MAHITGKTLATLVATDYDLGSGSSAIPSDRPDCFVRYFGDIPQVTGGRQIKIVSAATYTLLIADLDKILVFTSGSAVTVTVPVFATTAISPGSDYDCVQAGAGLLSFSDAGATVINTVTGGAKATAGQHSRVRLLNTAEDAWNLSGQVAAGA